MHLVDGTYELFRYYFALPGHRDDDGVEVDAVRGVLGSTLALLEEGATHVGVATDHVIESFRNDMWPGYKTSAGIEPELLAQFPLLEDALRALGVTVWAMVDLEADDALAAAARTGAEDPRVEQVVICTPDKDLAQCVTDPRVVQLDRRQRRLFDEAAVREKFGVSPASIPDWLALVGDNADGFPGLPGVGREVGGLGAGALRAPRGDPGRPEHVGRPGTRRGKARGDARGRARGGHVVPRPRHPARRRAGRCRRRLALARAPSGARAVHGAIRRARAARTGAEGRRGERAVTTVRREPIQEGITLLTLDRPERLNAMSRELVHDLHEALDAVDDDRECRVVILTGAGRGFCAGLDLKETGDIAAEVGRRATGGDARPAAHRVARDPAARVCRSR